MSETRILGILVRNRRQNIEKMQDTLTKFGCSIRTRLGINVSKDYKVEDAGLVLLELTGEIAEMEKLEITLKSLEGIEVQKMTFE
jgi:hypothetical protein